MGKSRGHDRGGTILDSAFRHPQAAKTAPTLPTGSTPPPTGGLSPFICPEGSPFWSRLLSAPPTGVNTLGRRGCFRLPLCLRRVISSDKRRGGGGLSPPCRLESLSLQWPDTHLAWPGPRVSAVPLHGGDLQVAAHWEVLLPRTPVHLYRDGLHLYAVQGNKQQDTSSCCRYVDVTLLDQRPQL